MSLIEEAIATLGVPGSIAVVIVITFAVLQLIGEFLEVFGKVAPTALKLRKLITKKRQAAKEQAQTLKDVKELLSSVNGHYSADNIAKRDSWMQWVNDRATVYDNTIVEYKEAIDNITAALNNNTKMTEQMFVETSRDRIIDFASKVSNPIGYVSKEEFNRIFKIYRKYEDFLQEHHMTNGEVEISYEVIQEAYKDHLENHKFLEDVRNKH